MDLAKCKCTAFLVPCVRTATQEDMLCDECRENTCCVLEFPEQEPFHSYVIIDECHTWPSTKLQGKEGQ